MEEQIYNNDFTLREYYDILVKMCETLETDPDNDVAVSAFVDAAYNLAKAKCGHLFPQDMLPEDALYLNASVAPNEGCTITAVKED